MSTIAYLSFFVHGYYKTHNENNYDGNLHCPAITVAAAAAAETAAPCSGSREWFCELEYCSSCSIILYTVSYPPLPPDLLLWNASISFRDHEWHSWNNTGKTCSDDQLKADYDKSSERTTWNNIIPSHHTTGYQRNWVSSFSVSVSESGRRQEGRQEAAASFAVAHQPDLALITRRGN